MTETPEVNRYRSGHGDEAAVETKDALGAVVLRANSAVLAQIAVALPAAVLLLLSAPEALVLGYLVTVTLVLSVIVIIRRVRR